MLLKTWNLLSLISPPPLGQQQWKWRQFKRISFSSWGSRKGIGWLCNYIRAIYRPKEVNAKPTCCLPWRRDESSWLSEPSPSSDHCSAGRGLVQTGTWEAEHQNASAPLHPCKTPSDTLCPEPPAAQIHLLEMLFTLKHYLYCQPLPECWLLKKSCIWHTQGAVSILTV